jgi:predicted glycogen debranching enzyme
MCADFAKSSSREWLETNGIGGFASSTISGANTRRYHGLLVAAVRPPVGRAVLLSKFEELLIVGGESFQLSANQYPGAIYPQGFKYLKKFRLDPFPVWTFEVSGVEIEKTIFMAHGENVTVIQYRVKGQKPADKITLELKPLLAFRDYHHLGHERVINTQLAIAEDHLSIHPDTQLPALCISYDAAAHVTETGDWYHNFEYAIERERGFDFHEDLYNPCAIKFDLTDVDEISLIASTEHKNASEAAGLKQTEIARREALVANVSAENAKDDLFKQLTLAADQFIVARGEEKTVIAGYHWFTDWGRDTMIALPGLTLATGRYNVAESILLEFSKHISQGMLPNRFPDAGEEPEYNTVDATLWYFEAIRAYTEATGNLAFVKDHLYEKLRDIINWHIQGTRYGIKVDPADGLLQGGRRGVQLTWMDAKIGDWVVTPRTGKAVEIQALWYNALRIMESFAEKFGDDTRKTDYRLFAEFAARHFESAFWNDAEQCLYDVISEGAKDASVRPNQIFAVSLPHTMLSPEKAQRTVEKVRDELLTPVGLRSLSPKDKKYTGVYIGSPLMRDGSYHQGTVWGWLIGPYITAHRKVFGMDNVRELLKDFEDHLTEAGLGTISEIFDGDPPHKPRGCIAQAWSVAEILRVL